jgi:SAM-dependent methyltransferase
MPRIFDPSTPELMDRPQPVSPELVRDLENLASLNRWFGSQRLVRWFLQRWVAPGSTLRVLDLCTGHGDLPRTMVRWARDHGVKITVEAVDAQASTLAIARDASADFPEITWFEGDALTYGAAGGYDLVHCSLALHHFSETDAVRLLQRFRELSRRWVLVADLERAPWTTLGVWLLTALIYREKMTQVDARESARRAFSFSEFRELARRAEWPMPGHERFRFCRQALWLEG